MNENINEFETPRRSERLQSSKAIKDHENRKKAYAEIKLKKEERQQFDREMRRIWLLIKDDWGYQYSCGKEIKNLDSEFRQKIDNKFKIIDGIVDRIRYDIDMKRCCAVLFWRKGDEYFGKVGLVNKAGKKWCEVCIPKKEKINYGLKETVPVTTSNKSLRYLHSIGFGVISFLQDCFDV